MTTKRNDIGNYDVTYRGATWNVLRSDSGDFWHIAEGDNGFHDAANTLADAKEFIRYQMDNR